jgi:Nif11 domain
MSWLELERLVEDAEKEPQLAMALRHCRSNPELVLAARRLGYRITRVDLDQARLADKKEHKQHNQAAHLSY